MVFRKFFGQSPRNGIIHEDVKDPTALMHNERLEKGVFKISSLISAYRDLDTILEAIARESLECLKAHRTTIFLITSMKANPICPFLRIKREQDSPSVRFRV
jgi:hypothetical protein